MPGGSGEKRIKDRKPSAEKYNLDFITDAEREELQKIIGTLVILIGGISIYFRLGNLRYQKGLKQITKTGVLDSEIKTTVEHKVLKREGYSIQYYFCGDKNR